jgi:hypothetical protein
MSTLTDIEAAVILVPYIGACYSESNIVDITPEFIDEVVTIAALSYDYHVRQAGIVHPHWSVIIEVAKVVPDARKPLAARVMLN